MNEKINATCVQALRAYDRSEASAGVTTSLLMAEHRWKDVFKNHSFNSFGEAGAVNRYGYQVIARA